MPMKSKNKIRGGMDRRRMSAWTATLRSAHASLGLAAGGLLVMASVASVTLVGAEDLPLLRGGSAISPA